MSSKTIDRAADPYACLVPLVAATDSPLTPRAFHERVNLAFHAAEAGSYDTLHRDLWRSLPAVFELLAEDIADAGAPERIRLLDVGCGTGLGTELLLRSPIGKRIATIDLLDTAPEMLRESATRSANWSITPRFHEGTLDSLPAAVSGGGGEHAYDLILTCSVLHHIPDLADFGRLVSERQAPGGFFLHLQDPNGATLGHPVLVVRSEEGQRATRWRRKWPRLRRLLPHRIAGRVWRELTGRQPRAYLDQVNETLLAEGTILRPMSSEEIWSVTDIHVDGLPFATGRGISVRHLRTCLPRYRLVTQRSYAFFSMLASDLPRRLANHEANYAAKNDQWGRQLAAVWQKTDDDGGQRAAEAPP